MAFSDYPALLDLQYKNGMKEFKSYRNDHAAAGGCDKGKFGQRLTECQVLFIADGR